MPQTLEAPAAETISEQFVDAGWWPYFKEHVNRDGVKFGREATERICRRANERIDESGDYAPLVLQHTRDNDPNFHPEYVGLVGPFRLGKVGAKKPVWAIFGRERVRKSKIQALKECPRRSVEYWADKDDPTNGYFDPVSALPAAVTPELDLGIHYQADPRNGSRTLMRYQKVSRYEAAPAEAGGANTYVPSGTSERKSRYKADGSLSPQDLQQIIAALSPLIKQAVEELGASLRPQGADPDRLLSPDDAVDDATDLDDDSGFDGDSDLDDAEGGEFAADDDAFDLGNAGDESDGATTGWVARAKGYSPCPSELPLDRCRQFCWGTRVRSAPATPPRAATRPSSRSVARQHPAGHERHRERAGSPAGAVSGSRPAAVASREAASFLGANARREIPPPANPRHPGTRPAGRYAGGDRRSRARGHRGRRRRRLGGWGKGVLPVPQ